MGRQTAVTAAVAVAAAAGRTAALHHRARALAAALAAGALLVALPAGPAGAATVTVHGWEAGESVHYELRGDAASARTHVLETELDGTKGKSFCIDLDHYVSRGSYGASVHDPASAAAAIGDGRQFAEAASLAESYAHELDALSDSLGVDRAAALTGVQVGIWEATYGDDFRVLELSPEAQTAWASLEPGRGGEASSRTAILDFDSKQDQTFTAPVPEPGAALLFGLGAALASARIRRAGRG